jgi:hypothetical protein
MDKNDKKRRFMAACGTRTCPMERTLTKSYVSDCYADKYERQNNGRPEQQLLDTTSRSERAGSFTKQG